MRQCANPRKCESCHFDFEAGNTRRRYCSDECRRDGAADTRHWNRVRAAAVHEAAHAIAAFHFDNDIRGVRVEWYAAGMLVSEPGEDSHFQIKLIVGAFAQVDYLERLGRRLNWDEFLNDEKVKVPWPWGGCINDFQKALAVGTNSRHLPSEHDGLYYMRRLFKHRRGVIQIKPEHARFYTASRALTRNADALVRVYSGQIDALADAIFSAPNFRLTAKQLAKWRDEHFQRCDVALSARAAR